MNKFVKILSTVIILCMITTSVFAAELAGEIKDGDAGLIELDFKLSAFPDDIKDISAVTVRYTFDESKLDFVTVKSDLLPGIMSTAGNILWYDSSTDSSGALSAEELTQAEGKICTVVFKKAENAYGDTNIEITLAEFADSSFAVSEEITANAIVVNLGEKEDDSSGDDNTNTDDGSTDGSEGDNSDGGADDNTGEDTEDGNTGSDNSGSSDNDNSGSDNSGNTNTGNDTGNSSNDNKDKGKGNVSKGNGGISVPAVTQPQVQQSFGGFADIASDNWAYEHAYALMQKGIIAGDGAATPSMRPNDNITREEAVKIALLAMGAQPEQGLSTDFADVADISDWAVSYIATAVKLGIINGYSDGTIGAKNLITREQMLTILARAMGWDIQNGELTFADNAEVSDWARDSIAHAVEIGVMTGYTDNTVRPKANITRAETFALVNRCLK